MNKTNRHLPDTLTQSSNQRLVLLVLLGLLFSLLPLSAAPVLAGTSITVTTFQDELNSDGDCSLREAVQAANTNQAVDACPAGTTGQDIITLDSSTYTLSISGKNENNNRTGDLDIGADLKLVGQGATNTVIDAGQIDRIMDIMDNLPLDVDVEITGITIQNGRNPGNILFSSYDELLGGAIRNSGRLILRDSVVRQNTATFDGGGIADVGITQLINSTVTENQTIFGVGGGIVTGVGGKVILQDSTVSNNSGGGIMVGQGTLELYNSQVSGNDAPLGLAWGDTGYAPPGAAGGIGNFEGQVRLVESEVTNNSAARFGGGIWSGAEEGSSTLSITDSVISNNQAGEDGGGIYHYTNGTMTIQNSTVSNNIADANSGGIVNVSTAIIMETTIADNQSKGRIAGGIGNVGTMEISASTIRDNTAFNAGGIHNDPDGVLTITDTTIQGNTSTLAGGGVRNDGEMTITRSRIDGNVVTRPDEDAAKGGGVFNLGQLEIGDNTRISNNSAGTAGGGIANTITGTLTLRNTRVQTNTARLWGGGIANEGAMTIANVTVEANSSADGTGGGVVNGIEEDSATLTLTDSTIRGNSARVIGGISNLATLSMTNTQVLDNRAQETVGGIGNSGTMLVTASTIRNNRAAARYAGGLFNGGNLTLRNSRIADNWAGTNGGGIQNGGGGDGGESGTLTLRDTTLQGNQADADGGAIFNTGAGSRLLLQNSSLLENSAGNSGGGISSNAAAELVNSTISVNNGQLAGGGIFVNASGTLTGTNLTISHNGTTAPGGVGGGIFNNGEVELRNSIVADSSAGGDCGGSNPVTSLGHNLAGDNTCGFSATGDLVATDPRLGPPADNGGATLTRSLPADSPAIDAGDSRTCPATDQRGAPRPADGDGDGRAVCDIGAYEAGAMVPTPTPTATPTATGTPTTTRTPTETTIPEETPSPTQTPARGPEKERIYLPLLLR